MEERNSAHGLLNNSKVSNILRFLFVFLIFCVEAMEMYAVTTEWFSLNGNRLQWELLNLSFIGHMKKNEAHDLYKAVIHPVCSFLFPESSKTYYRSLSDAKTRRTMSKTSDHKTSCRRQARKRDVSFKSHFKILKHANLLYF